MFKTKIKSLLDKEPNTINLLQSQDSTIIEIARGKNRLKFDYVNNYFNSTKEDSKYFIDLLFSYKKNLFYTVNDESYWCPTCERMIRKHYSSSSNTEIKEILNTYRETMSLKSSSFGELIETNYPILSLFPSGKYIVSLRNIFPTYGEDKLFSDFEDEVLPASTDYFYQYLGGDKGHISASASTSYMLPTQPNDVYSEETLNSYREKDYLGRGLVVKLSGFLGCLLDGHHKAKVAYERNQQLECLVIEPYTENIVYTGMQNEGTSLNFRKIPSIEEFCYLQTFIEDNDISSVQDLLIIVDEIVVNKEKKFYADSYEEMEQLIVALNVFNSEKLPELYAVILENYLYKNIRLRYFNYLSLLERTEAIEQLMLDFLINDDYENKSLTKLCEDYFR